MGSDHEAFGANLFSNSTGSVAWYRNTIEKIIGVIPDYDCLRIEPNVPAAWDEFEVIRIWRGAKLEFKFKRTGKFAIQLNGGILTDTHLKADLLQAGNQYKIEITF